MRQKRLKGTTRLTDLKRKTRIKSIVFSLELTEQLHAWYVGVGDEVLAMDCLNIAFTRMFALASGKHLMNYVQPKPPKEEELRDSKRRIGDDGAIDLRVVTGMVQTAYGWMLFELVFDKLGEVFEMKRLRVNPHERTLYVKVSCNNYE